MFKTEITRESIHLHDSENHGQAINHIARTQKAFADWVRDYRYDNGTVADDCTVCLCYHDGSTKFFEAGEKLPVSALRGLSAGCIETADDTVIYGDLFHFAEDDEMRCLYVRVSGEAYDGETVLDVDALESWSDEDEQEAQAERAAEYDRVTHTVRVYCGNRVTEVLRDVARVTAYYGTDSEEGWSYVALYIVEFRDGSCRAFPNCLEGRIWLDKGTEVDGNIKECSDTAAVLPELDGATAVHDIVYSGHDFRSYILYDGGPAVALLDEQKRPLRFLPYDSFDGDASQTDAMQELLRWPVREFTAEEWSNSDEAYQVNRVDICRDLDGEMVVSFCTEDAADPVETLDNLHRAFRCAGLYWVFHAVRNDLLRETRTAHTRPGYSRDGAARLSDGRYILWTVCRDGVIANGAKADSVIFYGFTVCPKKS